MQNAETSRETDNFALRPSDNDIAIVAKEANERTPEQQVKDTQYQLKKYDVPATEQVQVEDPLTGERKMITLDRTGTHETKLIMALADPNLKREQKDHVLSMYLWERGKESASFLVDLMRYKGQYSKESRVFESRMRFDFESFVSSFVTHLQRQAERIGKALGVDILLERNKFEEWLKMPNNKGKGLTYYDHCQSKGKKKIISVERAAMIEQAIYDLDEAEQLLYQIERIKQSRTAQKGGGIYVSRNGRPYSTNDENIDDLIKEDRKLQREAENDAN